VRSSFRLRVGGLTLHVAAPRPTRFLEPPAPYRPFLATRGGDIRLELLEAPAPQPDGALLFESEGVWRVHGHDGGLLYSFRTPRLRPALYKAVQIDVALTRGRLFFPRPLEGARPRFAPDYPLDELLFQHRLARDGALQVHACGLVAAARQVALFCGVSGAGKSTTARLWRRHRRGTRILSDDRIVLRESAGRILAYGTPWHGDGGFARDERAPLGAVFFLKQAGSTASRRLKESEAAALLLARSFVPPWDALAVGRALELSARVARAVPCFELEFRPDRSAVDAVSRLLG
jgi:hypothetical protein